MHPEHANRYVQHEQLLAALERLPDADLSGPERELKEARMGWVERQISFSLYQNRIERFNAGERGETIAEVERPALNPDWFTSTVVALAREMHASADFSAMPILADALQDAGCDRDDVLNHCRDGMIHVRGCWVVELIRRAS